MIQPDSRRLQVSERLDAGGREVIELAASMLEIREPVSA